MSTIVETLRAIAKHGLILLLGATMSGCGFGRETWKEEVLLSDGRVIVVKNELITEPGGDELAINRAGIKPKEFQIHFEFPEGTGQMVGWVSRKRSPDTWPEMPLVIDFESGHPVVFSIVMVSLACEVYSKYIYVNGGWSEVQLPDHFERLETNLFLKVGANMPRFVDLKTKKKVNASVDYRRSLKQVGPNRKVCE